MQQRRIVDELDGLREQQLLTGFKAQVFADALNELGAKPLTGREEIVVQRIEFGQVLGEVVAIEDLEVFHVVGLSGVIFF